jgi:hypothetical protein
VLNYEVVPLGSTVAQMRRVLVPLASQISDLQLVYDSTGALHCAWIAITNNGFIAQQLTVSDPHASVVTLYQSSGVIESLSAGADARGRVFFSWLDQRSGIENVAYVALQGSRLLGPSQQITHVNDALFAPQLAVYPDGTMAVTVLHLPGYTGLWQLEVRFFTSDGTPVGPPLIVAQQLRPSLANVTQQIEFQQNPLAVQLDGQQRLHIVWATLLDLGEATVVRISHGGKLLNRQTLAADSLYYLSPCLSTRLASPGNNAVVPTWITWADAANGSQIFLGRINEQGKLDLGPQQLVLGLKDAFEPCVGQNSHGTLYTLWQQYDSRNGYGLFIQIQNRPHSEPFWVSLGLNRDDPFTQIIFILLGSFFAALFPAAFSALGVPVGLILARISQRLHAPRVIALLVGFVPVWLANAYVASALNYHYAGSLPLAALPVGFIVGVLGVLLLYRRRPIAMKETLPAVGALIAGSYLAAIITSLPMLYVMTHVATS